MKMASAPPPNYAKILAAFKTASRPGAIFCYGDTIYNPSGTGLSKALIAHEMVHSRRQQNDPELWWDRYIADADFRLNEELLAHREEYRVASAGFTRNQRRQILRQIARRLASALYGNLISSDKARHLIGCA